VISPRFITSLLAVCLFLLAGFADAAPHPALRRLQTQSGVGDDFARRSMTDAFGRVASPGGPSSIASVSACASWSELSPDQTPFVRDDHCMVYDPVRDRLLIFGGTTASQISGEFWSNEVWSLSLGGTPMLSQVTTSGTPPPVGRAGASMIYDSLRDRIVIFGGVGNGVHNDVWELTLSGTPTWNEILPAGTVPSVRAYHTAIYDAARDQMLVFGGYDYDGGGDLAEVRILTFAGTPTWSLMTPTGTPPSARSFHSAVYDGPRNRMVIFGGYSGSASTPQNDTWALSLSGSGTWSEITPNGGPPAIRYGHTAIVDAPRNRMLVFGGFFDDEPYVHQDVWSLSFTNPIKWTQLSPTGPTPVPAPYFASIYDSVRQRMLSFSADEFWALSNLAGTPSWSMLTPPGQVPRQRFGAAVIYDAPRQRMLMFGGNVSPGSRETNDLWAYSLTGGSWTRITPNSQIPAVRFQATANYDPVGDRMIVFGGVNDTDFLNDTWQLSLAGPPTWIQLTPSGTPPPSRSAHSAILDQPRNRIIIYGGTNGSAMSDVWALSLSGGTSWSVLTPSGGPAPARQSHSAIFDSPRDRMLTFGGDSNVAWSLSLTGTPVWSAVSTTGDPPPTLQAHCAVYDAGRDRMLVSMGLADGGYQVDTYELTLAGTPTWGRLGTATPISGRTHAGALFDGEGDRWVLFGGGRSNDVQALSFPAAYPITVQVSPVAGGTVQQDPAGECQLAGAMVTLTAVPAANYSFVGWSGDASGTTNPLTVTMDAAKTITANFDNYMLNVTVAPPGAGTVTKNPNLTFYPPNSEVTLTANAATGYSFANWSGDATGSTNPLTLTMTSTKNVTANFVGYPVNVTISPAGAGTVTKNPNQATYAPGTQVTLTASTSPYPFLGWSGDASGSTNPIVVTVNAALNITASFEAYTLTTSVTPSGTGSVTKSPNQSLYAPGAPVTVYAVAVSGAEFSFWSGDASGTNSHATLTMDANKSVTANFSIPPPACGTWSLVPVTTTRPSPRSNSAATWDPVRHGVLIFGGGRGIISTYLNDVWRLTTGGTPQWTQIVPTGGPPSPRVESTAFYDPVRDRLIVYGGNDGHPGGGGVVDDIWALSLSGAPVWSQIVPSGTPPTGPRILPSLIYDPPRDRLIFFAGHYRCGTFCHILYNDVWQLSLAGTPTWTQLSPVGTPPPANAGYRALYDPVRDRMVVLAPGGAQVWALSLSGTPTWSDLTPIGAPEGGAGWGVPYDVTHDRAILVGSTRVSLLDFRGQPTQPLWCQVYPGGARLGNRQGFTAIYEPDQELVILFGGEGPTGYLDSAMRLDLSGGFFVDAGGSNGVVLLDDDKWCYVAGEIATLTGAPQAGYKFDHWLDDASGTANPVSITVDTDKIVQAEFVPATTEVDPPPVAFGLGEIHPNPSVRVANIAYSLSREAPVRLRIFDVAGREVAELVDGVQPAGRHRIAWDRMANGSRLKSGIYMIRYETPEGAWTKRLVLLE
jgi:uncharacterized repeat protein (TIGR02543 family)